VLCCLAFGGGFQATESEGVMETSLCWDHFGFCSGFHGLCENGITVILIENHDVVVSVAGGNWKLTEQV
jgi:hypothetical protein